ncbi:MAG: DUF3307 domain-containing protein [Alphaproteobacteria bacterium]|nr:DUF3307 domain-containing protein [Alphaproteobacteria bacterium]
MAETFLALLAAHLVADFPLQPLWVLERKKAPVVLVLHAVLVAVVAILLVGAWPIGLVAILLVTHLAMDAVKIHILGDSLKSFAVDQFVHAAVIAGLAGAFPDAASVGWWSRLPGHWPSAYWACLCLLSGTILSVQVGAIVIRKAIAPLLEQTGGDIAGLRNGGYYIGCLERALVMLLVLINQPAGIGFLITAKSILRFGDVKESGQRKLAEYIIIGTFLSFGWGLFVAAVTQSAIRHWLP